MNTNQLIADLAASGIRIEAHGDRLRYSPRSAMTPDLADRLKAHKAAILAILNAEEVPLAVSWHAALDALEGDAAFPAGVLADCRRVSVRWDRPQS